MSPSFEASTSGKNVIDKQNVAALYPFGPYNHKRTSELVVALLAASTDLMRLADAP